MKNKKSNYLKTLIASILVTGTALFAAQATEEVSAVSEKSEAVKATKEDLAAKIAQQEEEIKQMLKEIEEKQAQMKLNERDALRMADWYSKPYYESDFLSLLGSYSWTDGESKKYNHVGVFETGNDGKRREFGGASANMLSSGWINGTSAYDDNTATYDYVDTVLILPLVKAPEVETPAAPSIAVTPVEPTLSMNLPVVTPVTIPTPHVSVTAPTVTEPNANPFSNYNFGQQCLYSSANNGTAGLGAYSTNPIKKVFWGGINPETGADTNAQGIGNRGASGGLTGSVTETGSTRFPNLLYVHTTTFQGADIHAKGYSYGTTGYKSSGGTALGDFYGQIGIHTINNVTLKDINGYLYGNAAFISIETWHNGKVDLDSVKVDVEGEENTIFYIYPATYTSLFSTSSSFKTQRGGFEGNGLNADIKTNNNNVYVQSGMAGAFSIKSKGIYKLEGSGNTVYSGLGYAANYEKLKKSTNPSSIITATVPMTPTIELLTAPESYGDENVIMFFNTKADPTNLPGIFDARGGNDSPASPPFIGIYQGEIVAKALIGNQLQITTPASSQTTDGNKITDQTTGSKIVGDASFVERNIGIYSKSGQRSKYVDPSDSIHNGGMITPSVDLRDDTTSATWYDADSIHNLEIAGLDIQFGKYSKNGIMLVSSLGTVIDILGSTRSWVEPSVESNKSASFTDGVSGADTDDSKAALNTVVAYSTGVWDKNATKMTSADAIKLDGLPSEINIFIPLTMTSKEGIAYFADKKGIINMKSNTIATGYGSIVAYANNGKINVAGTITAKDAGSLTNNPTKTYSNIGAAAENGGTVTVGDKADIYGIGAYASGAGSTASLNANNNVITSGENGALVAKNSGKVTFAGGTIIHGDPTAISNLSGVNFDETVPFYANSNGIVDFTGATTIKMSKGVLFIGNVSDYAATSGGTELYQGMGNVTVDLADNGVNIGIFKNADLSYNGVSGYLSDLAAKTHVNAIHDNGYTFNSYLLDGTMNIVGALDLDSDPFKNVITMENEKIFINAPVTSVTGLGLSIGSNKGATTNATTAYENNSTVTITGGTNPVGLYTSFGTTKNNGTVSVDAGVAIAGVNGSKIENNGTISVTGSTQTASGVGIVGLRQSPTGMESFGLDKTSAPTITGNAVEITNNGDITVTGDYGIGIYANDNTLSGLPVLVTNTGKISTGNYGSGISVSNGGTVDVSGTGSGDITIGDNATGIYANNATVNLNSDYGIKTGDNSAAIYIKGNTTVTGNKLNLEFAGTSGSGSAAGLMYEGPGSATNYVNVDATNVAATSGTVTAMYAKNGGTLDNHGTLTLGTKVAGMVGDGVDLINNGTINAISTPNTGIYAQGGSVRNNGTINLGDGSNGVYAVNATSLINTGNITVGSNKSSGIYGGGTTPVDHQSGTITVGNNAVGVASEQGTLHVAAGAQINGGEQATYVYTTDGTGTVDADLTLSKYSVGIYSKNAGSSLTNNGTLTVGESWTGSTPVKVSVGMATEKGTVVNNNVISIPYDSGVGMVANDGGSAINNGTINVTGNMAYGMQASDSSYAINNGIINVDGNSSRGIAASKDAIVVNGSTGTIILNGLMTEGIYVEKGATVDNQGQIIMNVNASRGIHIGEGGVLINQGSITGTGTPLVDGNGSVVNVGDISIDGPVVSIDGITLTNEGTIDISGALDFGTVKLNTNEHVGSINAGEFVKGNVIVLPNVTQGNNKPYYVVQYLQGSLAAPNNGSLEAISQSVSYIADIQNDYDAAGNNIMRIVMVKVPYSKLFENTGAEELGKGLDEIYEGASGKELAMFDALDNLSDKSQLGAITEMEIRGNVYANIQQRILDINEAFDMSYENLRHERLYTKDSLKLGLIATGNKRKFKKASVDDYKSQTYGLMAVQEYDTRKYGRRWNWSIGGAHTDFDFSDTDNEEEVYSMNFGLGYEDYVGSSTSWKWYTRGEVSINHHDTDRKIHLPNGTYTNNAKFWSEKGFWNNKLRYEIPLDNSNVKAGVFGTFRLGYGRFENFKETGDGMRLDIKDHDMYFIRPGVGADVEYTKFTKRGKIVLYGSATYEYEFGKTYDGPNKAKIKNTKAGYYSLEKPKNDTNIIKLSAGARISSRCGHSIGAEVSRYEGAIDSTRVGVNVLFRIR